MLHTFLRAKLEDKRKKEEEKRIKEEEKRVKEKKDVSICTLKIVTKRKLCIFV